MTEPTAALVITPPLKKQQAFRGTQAFAAIENVMVDKADSKKRLNYISATTALVGIGITINIISAPIIELCIAFNVVLALSLIVLATRYYLNRNPKPSTLEKIQTQHKVDPRNDGVAIDESTKANLSPPKPKWYFMMVKYFLSFSLQNAVKLAAHNQMINLMSDIIPNYATQIVAILINRYLAKVSTIAFEHLFDSVKETGQVESSTSKVTKELLKELIVGGLAFAAAYGILSIPDFPIMESLSGTLILCGVAVASLCFAELTYGIINYFYEGKPTAEPLKNCASEIGKSLIKSSLDVLMFEFGEITHLNNSDSLLSYYTMRAITVGTRSISPTVWQLREYSDTYVTVRDSVTNFFTRHFCSQTPKAEPSL